MTGAMTAMTMSCLTITKTDGTSLELAATEQERVNDITERTGQSNTHLVFDSSALTNDSRMSEENADKVLAAVGVNKNSNTKYGYNVYPYNIVWPTSTSRGSFMASIRVYYDGLVNESPLGTDVNKRVKIFLSNTETLVTQNNMEQAKINIMNGFTGTDNIPLTSTKTMAQAVAAEGLPTTSGETSEKDFSSTTINNFGISLSNNKPSLLNLMGTTIKYQFTSGASPKPLLKLWIKNGATQIPTPEKIQYDITFVTPIT